MAPASSAHLDRDPTPSAPRLRSAGRVLLGSVAFLVALLVGGVVVSLVLHWGTWLVAEVLNHL